MKSTYFIAAFVALAQAKSIDDIPACARDCLRNSVKKVTPQCGESDFHCICPKFDAVRGDAAGCVLGACGAETGKGKHCNSRGVQRWFANPDEKSSTL